MYTNKNDHSLIGYQITYYSLFDNQRPRSRDKLLQNNIFIHYLGCKYGDILWKFFYSKQQCNTNRIIHYELLLPLNIILVQEKCKYFEFFSLSSFQNDEWLFILLYFVRVSTIIGCSIILEKLCSLQHLIIFHC